MAILTTKLFPLAAWALLAFVLSPVVASSGKGYSLTLQTPVPARFVGGAVVEIGAHGTDTVGVRALPMSGTPAEAIIIEVQGTSTRLEPGNNFQLVYQGKPTELYPAAISILRRLSDDMFFKVVVEFRINSPEIAITRLFGVRCGPTEDHCP